MAEVRNYHWFWSEYIWLPPNMTWADVTPKPGSNRYTNFGELWYPIPAGIILIFIRGYIMKNWFQPLGTFLGIKYSIHKKPPTNELLEAEYKMITKDKKYSPSLKSLSANLDMSDKQIEIWFRRRKLYGKPTKLDKFCETGWRWLYYTGMTVYGVWCLWDKPWLWNILDCWYNYPHHDIERSVWWYYMIELSFYWSLSISQFTDVKRKDFVEMFIHHLTTIALLSFSWTCNLTRCGSLVLLTHDCADIFLEAAKMLHYAKLNMLCDITFAVFLLVWTCTRLGVFPTWIFYSSTVEAPQILEMFPAYYIFNGLFSVLLILHVVWTYFIYKVAYRSLTKQGKKQDTRSDSEEESDDDIESDSEDIKDITNNEAQDIVNSKIIGSNHDATKED